jgi:lipoprotein-anchoring transpeptidase ErfK/SrfK
VTAGRRRAQFAHQIGIDIMQLRTLLLLGLLSGFAPASSAFAAPPPANEPSIPAVAEQADVLEVAAAKTDDASALKKKKLAAAKAAEEKKAAKAKAAEEKKAAKAKADAEKKKIAEAKAKEAAKLKKIAEVKAAKEKQIAERAKAAEEKRLAKAKADEARKLARLKAEEERQQAAAAKVKAAEQRKLLLAQAAEQRRQAAAKQAEAARQAEISRLASMEITKTGNNGELRSESAIAPQKPVGLFAGLFGGSMPVRQSMLPETQALDAALEQKQARKAFKVKPEFEPQEVTFSGYPRGTIVIDTNSRFLYLVNGMNSARRYAIAVGRDGLQYKGTVKVADKQEWPRWIPTLDMQKREPKKYGQYKDGMPGGGDNPLGARAIYLYENGKDTHLRIHGTTQPQTIGTNSSNGCFRMINEHVMDLYRRVPVGTNVVVL